MTQESLADPEGPGASQPSSSPAGPRASRGTFPPSAWAWLAGALALALFAYRDLLRFEAERKLPDELEEWFFVPSDTLGPMVLALSAWLLYRRWGRLRALPSARGSWAVAAPLLAAGLGAYVWATYTGAPDLLVPALMLQGSAALWLWKGAPALRVAGLPVAFLLFAIPIPAPALNELIFRLQIATTDIAGFFLYLLEVPHYVAGEQILRTEQTFSVIESCSGLRSIQTLTMVAVLMADLFRRPPLHAWLVLLAAPGVAFFLNGIRALLLILNPHSEVVAIHNLQGVAILLGGLLLLFFWDGLLEKVLPARRAGAAAPAAAAPAAGPDVRRPVGLVLALAAACAVSLWLPRFEPLPPARLAASARLAAGLGLSEELEVDRRFLGSVGFQESFLRRFEMGEDDVFLFLGVGDRGARTRSPLSPKTGIPASGWVVESQQEQELEGGERVRVRVMRAGSRRILVYHWYQGAAGWRREALRSLLALDRSPWRRPGEILAVRLGVPIHGPLGSGRVAAEEKLLSFYYQLRPLLQGIEEELSRKSFSRFSGSGKTFSSETPGMIDKDSFEISNLNPRPDTAWDLLYPCAGVTLCPEGVQADLQSLGWIGSGRSH